MANTTAISYSLEFAGADYALAASGILLRQSAFIEIGQNLFAFMWTNCERTARLETNFIERGEDSKTFFYQPWMHPVGKRETGFMLAMLFAESIHAFQPRDHLVQPSIEKRQRSERRHPQFDVEPISFDFAADKVLTERNPARALK